MQVSGSAPPALFEMVAAGGAATGQIESAAHRLSLAELSAATSLSLNYAEIVGRSVWLCVADMATAAAALIELDGVARRLVLCPPGLESHVLGKLVSEAEIDLVARDPDDDFARGLIAESVVCSLPLRPVRQSRPAVRATEWALLTSGTTGGPKLVIHTLQSLMHAISPRRDQRWATFYDIRRFGGLQILLRALAGNGLLTLAGAKEPVERFLTRLARSNPTHVSGTPSHWRIALMCEAQKFISPEYVRLSGEIADQTILDNLRARFPRALVAHAYASTEAGVIFEIEDGLAGFPRNHCDRSGLADIRVDDGTLRVRSPGAASRYLGLQPPALHDAEGYVDTGDMVELRGERYHFLGRRGGVINVGGSKVHPEEVEDVILRHGDVQACRVYAEKNRLTGQLVAADVVLKNKPFDERTASRDILALCRAHLAEYKTPFKLRFVDELGLAPSGKSKRGP